MRVYVRCLMWYAVLVSTTLEPCRGMGGVIVLAHVTGAEGRRL